MLCPMEYTWSVPHSHKECLEDIILVPNKLNNLADTLTRQYQLNCGLLVLGSLSLHWPSMTEEKSVRQSGKGLWNIGSLPRLCMFWNVEVSRGHSWLGQGVLSHEQEWEGSWLTCQEYAKERRGCVAAGDGVLTSILENSWGPVSLVRSKHNFGWRRGAD